MKPVLGSKLRGRRVVSSHGLDIGNVLDATFNEAGKMTALVIEPERETKQIKDYVEKSGYISIPFEEVRAVGRYVVVSWPPK